MLGWDLRPMEAAVLSWNPRPMEAAMSGPQLMLAALLWARGWESVIRRQRG